MAGDVYRPAAIKQLEIVGAQLEVPVFTMGDQVSPVQIAKAGIEHAKRHGHDMVFIDTAGRLQVDEKMMGELLDIKEAVNPNEILLVVDSMTGQVAVDVAKTFNEQLDITGVVMTKLDGDTRGGAALSIKYVTGKPIKFVGMGEKLDTIEPFHPDRMASRILGMGDVLTLIEKAQSAYDEKQAIELEKKMREQRFTLDDYLDQFDQLSKMGDMEQILGMMPGVKPGQLKDLKIDEKDLARTKAIILSMTKKEREKPEIINLSRKKRIAAGSGTSVEAVGRLLKQFETTNKMMKQLMNATKTKGFGKRKFGGFHF